MELIKYHTGILRGSGVFPDNTVPQGCHVTFAAFRRVKACIFNNAELINLHPGILGKSKVSPNNTVPDAWHVTFASI
jgi:hypothetical protein